MPTLYHGTNCRNGIQIATAGAIKSPWYQVIDMLKIGLLKRQKQDPNITSDDVHPGKTIEEAALEIASTFKAEKELEHRIKAVSMTLRFDQAMGYADNWEMLVGGIVLGLDFDQDYLDSEFPDSKYTYFIPGEVGLDRLCEVHMTLRAKVTSERQIRKAYQRFSPKFFQS